MIAINSEHSTEVIKLYQETFHYRKYEKKIHD